MRGSGVATASSADAIAFRGSYSTSIRSRASVAVSSLVAATAATGSPMKRTLSRQSACSSWDTGRMPNGIGRSFPVRTAITPWSRSAAPVCMRRIFAWGSELRSSLQYSIRGNVRSSANLVTPVTFATASIFRRNLPMTLYAAKRCLPQAGGGQFDCLVDLEVSGAATEVARERFLDLLSRRLGIRGEQGFGGEHERGSAVAALRGSQVRERFLQRVQPGALSHPLHRLHAVIRAGETEDETREHGRPVQQHGAGAALPQLTAVFCSGEVQIFAQHLEQRLMGREGYLGALTVDVKLDGNHPPNVIAFVLPRRERCFAGSHCS